MLVILDRDGVINEESADFICAVSDWLPIPGSLEAIAALSRAGHTVAVVTNQSGLGRGLFGIGELEAIHAELHRRVGLLGGRIAGIFHCPHRPDAGCSCRKPATGLLTAMEDALGVSARGAVLIGDRLSDLQAAGAYGCRPVLVRTGRGRATWETLRTDGSAQFGGQTVTVFDDLAAAARALLGLPPP